MKLSKLLTLTSLVGLLFLQSCGVDDKAATTAAASSVTISGSMSLTDASTTGIINSGSGVLPLAATGDSYELYCVGFVSPPPSCTMTIKGGVFSSACADFASVPFGCFAVSVANKEVFTLVSEPLSCSGGGEIELTIVFDEETGSGTLTAQIKTGKKVEVTADQLANMDVWLDGMLYSMKIKGKGEKDVLGLPEAVSAIVKAQGGPQQGQKPEGPDGPKPGDKMDVFLQTHEVGTTEKLVVSPQDITTQCPWNAVKEDFDYTFGNGTKSVALDVSTLSAYENSMKSVLDTVFSASLKTALLKEIEARVADRFGHCDQLKDEKNNPISEANCVFGYPNPEIFAKAKPGDFRAFAELTAADIIKVSTSDAAGPGPEANTYEPAIDRIEYRDENGNLTDDSTKATMSFSFPQILNVWCPDPFRAGALNSYPVRLTSKDEVLKSSQAISRLKSGDDNKRILDDRGCSDTAKNDELRREFGRVIAELFEFLSREAEAAVAPAAVISLEQSLVSECARQLDSQKLAEIKKLGQQALKQFSDQGPANKNFEGFKGKDFDPNRNAPQGGNPQFGGAPPEGYQPPPGHQPGQPPPLQPQEPAKLLAQKGPNPGPQGGVQHDPGIIECAKRDGNKDDFSDEDARCYMGRFVPPALAILCGLSTPLRNELDAIRAKSCIPRGVRVEPICEEKSVEVTQDGQGKAQGPAFQGFECEPQLVVGHLSPAAAYDVMTRKSDILAPFFGYEAFDGPFNRYIDDGTGVPQKCTESFGVQMIGTLPKDGDGKILLKTDIIEGRISFNDKNTCNERKASEGVDVEKEKANREMRFTATPK